MLVDVVRVQLLALWLVLGLHDGACACMLANAGKQLGGSEAGAQFCMAYLLPGCRWSTY